MEEREEEENRLTGAIQTRMLLPTELIQLTTKNNNILKLQCFLKHNDFAEKSINKLKFSMLEDLTKTNQ
jgi:hypothetical protein